MEVMGIDPVHRLVLPRLLAGTVDATMTIDHGVVLPRRTDAAIQVQTLLRAALARGLSGCLISSTPTVTVSASPAGRSFQGWSR